ncbi:hypothetical protein J8G26_03520 [Acidovorax sp. JG5]|uniref:hypothetical protein n=1 Tax=Acidovorax sp. JG5 TaxID=2822718 RepID=UPI001B3384D8|nr:hypothetical protein [Acidovorax sp. JG5]MBP3979801.1 hypothetical protein [Acidovorax sp. JG5]
MNLILRIPLQATPEQATRLLALQQAFAQVCNVLAPLVQQTRVWNRVALHHLAYRQLREQFPALGSQMVCNAIYSVSRTCRRVYQNPASPFNLNRLQGKPLPLLRFRDSCPVYFDRHTLSVKGGQLSMFTLDGRMRFELALRPEDEAAFHSAKLREIVLARRRDGVFELSFYLETAGDKVPAQSAQVRVERTGAVPPSGVGEIPEYVMVEKTA